jgi:hypothetical protein
LLQGEGKISAALGAFYCVGADIGAFLRRFGTRTPWYIKEQIKAVLPAFVLTSIRQARQRASVSKERARTCVPP